MKWVNADAEYETPRVIWCHMYNLKNAKNTHGGVLLLVKKQSNTPPSVFYKFLKLHKRYKIAQIIIYTRIL